jgi:hydrogenase-4 component B
MQDTAEGFGQPIRQIFDPFFQVMQRELPIALRQRQPRYRVTVGTTSGAGCTCPVMRRGRSHLARLFGLLQQGRIAVYLLYSFVTLLTTLLVVMR